MWTGGSAIIDRSSRKIQLLDVVSKLHALRNAEQDFQTAAAEHEALGLKVLSSKFVESFGLNLSAGKTHGEAVVRAKLDDDVAEQFLGQGGELRAVIE